MSLAKRSVTSVSWNVVANILRVIILFGRSVLLARLLPVETFGVYSQATAVVQLTIIMASFGMGGAFLHRAPETEDEELAAAVHFTLESLIGLFWVAVMLIATFIFTTGSLRSAMVVLIFIAFGQQLMRTPSLIFQRRIIHQRLALMQTITAVSTTIIALFLAWKGFTLWALLATNILTLLINIVMMYIWKPIWRPRFTLERPIVRYYLQFGRRHFPAVMLLRALDRVDDIWTGIFLGHQALGFYSRAYSFATYPSQVLAAPLNLVAGGTYAELKEDPQRLSQAFFRVNALLVRAGFFMGGALVLVAPEFIRLILGEKWLPMLTTYQLMIVFTLFDPMKTTIASLYVAVGKPEEVARARIIQLLVMIVGLFTLGLWLGIIGVTLAVDLMLIVGIILLLKGAQKYVTISMRKLFVVPSIGLLLAYPVAYRISLLTLFAENDWATAFVKLFVFVNLYAIILLIFERKQMVMLIKLLRQYL